MGVGGVILEGAGWSPVERGQTMSKPGDGVVRVKRPPGDQRRARPSRSGKGPAQKRARACLTVGGDDFDLITRARREMELIRGRMELWNAGDPKRP